MPGSKRIEGGLFESTEQRKNQLWSLLNEAPG